MATIEGKAYWASIATPNTTFDPDGVWTVDVGNLEILRQEDLNTITVSLTYNVINTNISDTLEIDFA